MATTLQDNLNYLDDFRGDTSSDTVDPATEGLRAINFILNDLLQRHQWEFCVRRKSVLYYQSIREYAMDSSYQALVGVYEQLNFRDPFEMTSPIEFQRRMNQSSNEDLLAEETSDGVLTLFINFVNHLTQSLVFLSNTSTTAEGAWAVTGVASALQTDTLVYFDNAGCIRFDATGVGAATITNSTFTAKDLSSLKTDYKQIFKIWIPDASKVTNLILSWGPSASVYHSVTVTTQANGRAFKDGLNVVAFDVKDSTDVGTVTEAAFTFCQLTVTVTAALKSIRVSEMRAESPTPLDVVFYSNKVAYDFSAATWFPTFQDATDPNNDYGAWSGTYDWFQNLINLGTAWQVLLEMQEDDRAEKYRIRYEGQNADGGALAQAIRKLPSKIKKRRPPSLGLSSASRRDYYDET